MTVARISRMTRAWGAFILGMFRRFVGVTKFRFLEFCCKILRPKIALGYDPSLKTDGVGAQIQRILALRSLAHNLGLGYVHSTVDNVAIHPFDPYQSIDEMKVFLKDLNHVFHMDDMDFDRRITHAVFQRRVLTFGNFFVLIFKSLLNRTPLLIYSVEPFPISEFDSKKYFAIETFLPNFKARFNPTKTVALHYRQGVGGQSVQIGEKLSRQLDVQYFVNIINSILADPGSEIHAIKIYTDAPISNQEYSPPTTQSHLWVQSPRFRDGQMSIEGFDVGKAFEGSGIPIEVIRGGNPVKAIQEMAGADVLVIGRSSLSYIAAILNARGEIYYPRSFWHRPLSGWKVISDRGF